MSEIEETNGREQAAVADPAPQLLLQGDERFRILVESASDYAIFFLDTDGRIVDWNIGAERILGYSTAEIIGQSGDIIYTAEDRAAGVPALELATAKTHGRAVDERWHVRKNGTRIWASGIVTALYSDHGELIGLAKVMRDFTERKRVQEENALLLQRELEAREEAEAANRAKDEFISLVAHELRTPIAVALGWVHLLDRDGDDDETKRRGIDVLRRTLHSQNQVINDLLDVTRIATGKISLALGPVDLSELVKSVVESIRPTAQAKGVGLEVQPVSGPAVVTGDADRLQQVVLNLLGNALKFTPPRGKVEVRLSSDHAHYQLVVADSGIGIDADHLPHIFERYQQADNSEGAKHQGLGLGLWLVRHIVELHGGSVQAKSEGSGKGAAFCVELPAHEPGA